MRKYIPLSSGVFLSIATALNIQALIVSGWLYFDAPGTHHAAKKGSHERAIYIRPVGVTILSAMSACMGGLGIGALFVRMLEKKIKWTTRLFIAGAAGQGILSLLAVVTFAFWESTYRHPDTHLTEGPFYSGITALLSLFVAGTSYYHHTVNRDQAYAYVLYELSLAQRQLILLLITSIAYTFGMGAGYAWIEGWDFDDGIYWCISTLATIGFGDLVPQTTGGKLLLPLAAFFGIGILAATIYSVRQVGLELLTHRLASEYSRSFGIAEEAYHGNARPSSSGSDGRRRRNTATGGGDGGAYRRSSAAAALSIPIRHPATDGSRSNRRPVVNRVVPLASSAPSNPSYIHAPSSNNHTQDRPASPIPDRVTRSPSPPSDHHDYGLPLGRSYTTSILDPPRTLIVSRGPNLPQLTIVAPADIRRKQVVEATQRTFRRQIVWAVVVVMLNMVGFGAVFAWLEDWEFVEGLYFTFCALTTIGYGDYTLSKVQSRSIFIWFLYIGIGSVTYLFSLVAERALDQWTVTVNKITDRVDRYERKGALKRRYGCNKDKNRAGRKTGHGGGLETSESEGWIHDDWKQESDTLIPPVSTAPAPTPTTLQLPTISSSSHPHSQPSTSILIPPSSSSYTPSLHNSPTTSSSSESETTHLLSHTPPPHSITITPSLAHLASSLSPSHPARPSPSSSSLAGGGTRYPVRFYTPPLDDRDREDEGRYAESVPVSSTLLNNLPFFGLGSRGGASTSLSSSEEEEGDGSGGMTRPPQRHRRTSSVVDPGGEGRWARAHRRYSAAQSRSMSQLG
ncbi:hypothetical protein DFS34DRAFT_600790 [Phlyctochytrium arcticum]|nr:hypothetical protein DFS34DRAFT_600790 [Phlyctochytrium arcticum]